MRWRQCRHTGKLIPVDEAAKKYAGHYIQGDIETFVSPVDGSVISDRKQLEDHNRRNNVVNAAEFSPEYYASKAKERARFYEGEHTRRESHARKSEIYEIIMRAERNAN
ncbi:MAG: hypothetical protein DRR15_16515 [Gammaproteobacteria bacterium]|nr:MAG: hypothetical protein DRR15_16515 [Gammaproteobacteria bacterium]